MAADGKTDGEARAARLKAALRANLLKRKAQARGGEQAEPGPPDGDRTA
ncbi:MAG: hypothetical protein ACK4Z0_09930 [Sphingomonadaceae bacterium]